MALACAADSWEVTILLRRLGQAMALATMVGLTFAACAAASGHGASSRISLSTFPKPFGQVKSPEPRACAEGRRIMVLAIRND